MGKTCVWGHMGTPLTHRHRRPSDSDSGSGSGSGDGDGDGHGLLEKWLCKAKLAWLFSKLFSQIPHRLGTGCLGGLKLLNSLLSQIPHRLGTGCVGGLRLINRELCSQLSSPQKSHLPSIGSCVIFSSLFLFFCCLLQFLL